MKNYILFNAVFIILASQAFAQNNSTRTLVYNCGNSISYRVYLNQGRVDRAEQIGGSRELVPASAVMITYNWESAIINGYSCRTTWNR